jgi:hypothetical protein
LPTSAFTIFQRTVGEFLNSANLAKFDSSLSHLTRAVTLILTALYNRAAAEGVPLRN